MKRNKMVGVGSLAIGSRKVYTVAVVTDEEGRCFHLHVYPNDLPDLGIKRHPNIGKVEKFLNTEEGRQLIDDKVGFKVGLDRKNIKEDVK